MKKGIVLVAFTAFIFSGCASLATGTGENNNKLKELTAIEMDMSEKLPEPLNPLTASQKQNTKKVSK